MPKPRTPEDIVAAKLVMLRLKDANPKREWTPPLTRAKKYANRSKYQPHQGQKEINKRKERGEKHE